MRCQSQTRDGGLYIITTKPLKTTTLVVLAAGMGSRFGGTKQLETVAENGETILDYSIFDAVSAGFEKVVLVVRDSILSDFKSIFNSRWGKACQMEYVCQEIGSETRKKPWGTAHAVLSAREAVEENFCMINADDYYGKDAYRKMSTVSVSAETAEFSMVAFRLEKTLSSHGSVSRGQCSLDKHGFLKAIIERTGILSENGKISCEKKDGDLPGLRNDSIVSMNFWGFTPLIFDFLETRFEAFLSESGLDPTAEFFINDVVNWSLAENKSRVRVFEAEDEWMGITYQEDKADVSRRLSEMRQNGTYPEKLW